MWRNHLSGVPSSHLVYQLSNDDLLFPTPSSGTVIQEGSKGNPLKTFSNTL